MTSLAFAILLAASGSVSYPVKRRRVGERWRLAIASTAHVGSHRASQVVTRVTSTCRSSPCQLSRRAKESGGLAFRDRSRSRRGTNCPRGQQHASQVVTRVTSLRRGGPCQLRRSREEIGELISRSLASDTPPRRDDARGCDGPINTFPQPAAVRPATKSCRPRPGGSRKRGPRSRQVCERVVHEKYTVRAIKRQPFDSAHAAQGEEGRILVSSGRRC